jgi:hypothetical protein
MHTPVPLDNIPQSFPAFSPARHDHIPLLFIANLIHRTVASNAAAEGYGDTAIGRTAGMTRQGPLSGPQPKSRAKWLNSLGYKRSSDKPPRNIDISTKPR